MLKSATAQQPLITQILAQIAQTLTNLDSIPDRCGLFNGLTGDLLFLYKLGQYDATLIDETIFDDKLEFLQQHISTSTAGPNLSSGLCGQSWLLEYLNQSQGEDYDAELCEDIDEILHHVLCVDLWQGELEMVSGLGGFAVYAARRQLKSNANAMFNELLRHFEQAAITPSESHLAWPQSVNSLYRLDKDNPQMIEFNLGLAHGIPGIIAAILPALQIPDLSNRANTLLRQSCDWLITQELDHPQKLSFYACSNNDQTSSRLGWCYGDLTIALTLARVGKALEVPEYINKAKQIGLYSAERDEQQSMIRDAGICHGSAGLALIFQLLHQQIAEPAFLQAADKWLLHTLDLYQQKGLAGLNMYSGYSKKYEEDTGLLMGYGGIGLCLLSALGQDADWADCLLMA